MLKIEKVDVRLADRPAQKARVYFWPKGENLLQNLTNRRNRPINLWRELLPAALKQASILCSTGNVWSQKAGCGCGCSPGFVLNGPQGVDVHVTVIEVDES